MTTTRLIADVGGTNTRIGLFDEDENSLRTVTVFHNRDYASLEDVLQHWLDALDEPAPNRACIAAAAPPSGDLVNMINIGWTFSCSALARRFNLHQFKWLNDFQANAHGLPFLQPEDLDVISTGDAGIHTTLATVGPGTGLGGATLRWVNGKSVACNSEPGHAGLSPGTDLELEIFRMLLPQHGNIHAELFVCGAGLARLYQAVALIGGTAPELLDPAEISKRALANEDDNCVQALQTFCALLGSVCGDFVLCNGAYGGLFIAGGIIPRMTDFLRRSDFLPRLRHKGAMGQHLEALPVAVITHSNPGLIGAAHAPFEFD